MNKIEAHTALVALKEKFKAEEQKALESKGSYRSLLEIYGPMFEILADWCPLNEYLNVERDVHILDTDRFLDQVLAYGITSFTYSANACNALSRFEAFEKRGYKLEGLTTVVDRLGVHYPAALFTRHNPLVKD